MFDFPNSPTNGQQVTTPGGTYQWDGTKWAPVGGSSAAGGVAYNDIGRNYIDNATMGIYQRGTGPFNINGVYTLDRWLILSGAGGSFTVQSTIASDQNRADVGDEACRYLLNNSVTGGAGAGDYALICQRVEGVWRLSGKTVTVSFYANSSVANMKVGVSIDQNFGTGGSPSTGVTGTGQSVTLSATAAQFRRYNLTFNVPSIVGKTLGTNSNDNIQLNFWFSSGTTQANRAGNIGVQSGVVNMWGVQLEIGTAATAFEKIRPADDITHCFRFYQTGQMGCAGYAPVAGNYVAVVTPLQVPLRAVPPAIIIGAIVGSDLNVQSVLTDQITSTSFRFAAQATASGYLAASRNFSASADL
jgi:hypothetical protein